MSPVHLIDVSNHQSAVDWARVAGEQTHGRIVGAWAKASEGTGFRDRWYTRNRDGAAAAGLWFGAYHYAKPGLTYTPEAEAALFVDQTDKLAGTTLPPVLDLEEDKKGKGRAYLAEWAVRWCRFVEGVTGRQPVIYTGAFLAGGLDDPRLAEWPLWIAAYPAGYSPDPDPMQLRQPKVPPAWAERGWSIWQYTSSGRVNGVGTNCDRNIAAPSWWEAITHPQTEEQDIMDVQAIVDGIRGDIRAAARPWAFYQQAGTARQWVQIDGRNVFVGPKVLGQWIREGRIPATPVEVDAETAQQMFDSLGAPPK